MFNRGVEEARGVRGWDPGTDNIGIATLPFSSMPKPVAEDEGNEVSSSRYLCRLSELKLIGQEFSITLGDIPYVPVEFPKLANAYFN